MFTKSSDMYTEISVKLTEILYCHYFNLWTPYKCNRFFLHTQEKDLFEFKKSFFQLYFINLKFKHL